jgi:hypothetical protein
MIKHCTYYYRYCYCITEIQMKKRKEIGLSYRPARLPYIGWRGQRESKKVTGQVVFDSMYSLFVRELDMQAKC